MYVNFWCQMLVFEQLFEYLGIKKFYLKLLLCNSNQIFKMAAIWLVFSWSANGEFFANFS